MSILFELRRTLFINGLKELAFYIKTHTKDAQEAVDIFETVMKIKPDYNLFLRILNLWQFNLEKYDRDHLKTLHNKAKELCQELMKGT